MDIFGGNSFMNQYNKAKMNQQTDQQQPGSGGTGAVSYTHLDVYKRQPFLAVLLSALIVLRSGREEEEKEAEERAWEEGRHFDRLALAAVFIGLVGTALACHGGMRYSAPEDIGAWERWRIPGSAVSVLLPEDRSVIDREGMVGMQATGKKMTVMFFETEEKVDVDWDMLVGEPVCGEMDGTAYEDVSYTHLDVYKRQGGHHESGPRNRCHEAGPVRLFPGQPRQWPRRLSDHQLRPGNDPGGGGSGDKGF